jgi:hypothetical protein
MKAFTLAFILCIPALGNGAGQSTNPQTADETFRVWISGPKEAVPLGVGVTLTIKLTNVSDRDLNGGTGGEKGLDLGFEYDVRRIEGTKSYPVQPHFPAIQESSFHPRTLKPGEGLETRSTLNFIFDLAPGMYSVQVSRRVTDPLGKVVGADVKSNTVTFTIVPPPFTIEINTPSAEVKAGSPVLVNVRVNNKSTEELSFAAPPESAAVDSHYMYACRSGARSWNSGSVALDSPPLVTIKPGEHLDQQIDFAAACSMMSQPGTYRINLSRWDPDNRKWAFRSNEITVTVRP